jgi:predicted dehydrogenase
MPDNFNVAIVGAGRMAREHIRAFSNLGEVRIAGITSRSLGRAEALASEFKIPVVCNSLSELYERTRAHLVVVTVSSESMCAVACQSCAYEWTVLLEKPPGENVMEAETIHAASLKYSRKVLIALNRRFLSSTRAALSDLNRRLGPRHIQVLDQQDSSLLASFGHSPEAFKSLMFTNSIHAIDYFSVFGRGAIRSVHPIFRWNSSDPWLVGGDIHFENGDTGIYQAVWNAPGPWAVAVNTPEVRWEMRPLEHATYQLAGERRAVEIEASALDMEFKPGFRLQAEHVVNSVLGKPSEAATLDEAIQTMRLIAMLYTMDQRIAVH